MAEYTELKEQIKDLIANLQDISEETRSYSETSGTLADLADKMAGTCNSLTKVIEQTSEIYQHVNDISVRSTLDEFRKSSEDYIGQVKTATSEIQAAQQTIASDNKKTAAEIISQVKTENRKVLDNTDEKLSAFSAGISKKILIMGGISIVCAILAIVLSFI